MKTLLYDIAIIGSGPIGASTAYFLDHTKQKVIVLTEEPTDEHTSTYRFAGGSARWYIPNSEVQKMTSVTADFIMKLIGEGVDLSEVRDQYVFVNKGFTAPSVNVSGAKLVDYFLDNAAKKGCEMRKSFRAERIEKSEKGYVVSSENDSIEAKKIIVAVGAATPKLVPQAPVKIEKRELFVLDLPVDEMRQSFPHLVVPFAGGVVYLFIKKFPEGHRMVLGQERIVDYGGKSEGEDFLPLFFEKGLGELMPFLKGAKTEHVLWGFDMEYKIPSIFTEDNNLSPSRAVPPCARACISGR